MAAPSSFNLVAAFKLFVKKFKRIFIAPFTMLYRRIIRLISPQNIVGKISSDVKQSVKGITAKPKSIKEYYLFGEKYVAKKLVYALVLLFIIGLALCFRFVFPWAQAKWFTKTMSVTSGEISGYSGKVVLHAADDEDRILFRGTLADGHIYGEGTLYDYDGNLRYQGGFEAEAYHGTGTLYYPDGTVAYQGGFAAGLYDGEGKLYAEDGTLLYDGGFANGLYSGEGTLYDADGSPVYSGGFQLGVYHGTGTLYDKETGEMVFWGLFENGVQQPQ